MKVESSAYVVESNGTQIMVELKTPNLLPYQAYQMADALIRASHEISKKLAVSSKAKT
jgi:hypothetical protein